MTVIRNAIDTAARVSCLILGGAALALLTAAVSAPLWFPLGCLAYWVLQ